MTIEQHKDIQAFNTFGLLSYAQYFIRIADEATLLEVLNDAELKQYPLHIIGGGSNILLTKDIAGLLLRNEIKGIKQVHENATAVKVRFGAGENWHHCVLWTIAQGLSGIENLSLIPGTIGAAPIQNIGAYGVELKDVFVSLEAIEIATQQKKIFYKNECAFDYRTSIFKTTFKEQYIITHVTLSLSKTPLLNITYGNIKHELSEMGVMELSTHAISDAVIRIRQSKLPDPNVIGNAGSFFKNPTISIQAYDALKQHYLNMPSYLNADGVKIPAAWLIEHSKNKQGNSWKGYRIGNYGVHEKQALCLVNYGGANGAAIYTLSGDIITSVQQQFNITLEREVNVW